MTRHSLAALARGTVAVIAVFAISGLLWWALLQVVPVPLAAIDAVAALCGIAAGVRWMWTGHAVPPEGRR